MSFFDTLIEKRPGRPYLPLWSLKVTDSEYQQLKAILANDCTSPTCAMPFFGLRKEAALFYAEYWRREYKEGVQGKEMVFAALGLSINTFRGDQC